MPLLLLLFEIASITGLADVGSCALASMIGNVLPVTPSTTRAPLALDTIASGTIGVWSPQVSHPLEPCQRFELARLEADVHTGMKFGVPLPVRMSGCPFCTLRAGPPAGLAGAAAALPSVFSG